MDRQLYLDCKLLRKENHLAEFLPERYRRFCELLDCIKDLELTGRKRADRKEICIYIELMERAMRIWLTGIGVEDAWIKARRDMGIDHLAGYSSLSWSWEQYLKRTFADVYRGD